MHTVELGKTSIVLTVKLWLHRIVREALEILKHSINFNRLPALKRAKPASWFSTLLLVLWRMTDRSSQGPRPYSGTASEVTCKHLNMKFLLMEKVDVFFGPTFRYHFFYQEPLANQISTLSSDIASSILKINSLSN